MDNFDSNETTPMDAPEMGLDIPRDLDMFNPDFDLRPRRPLETEMDMDESSYYMEPQNRPDLEDNNNQMEMDIEPYLEPGPVEPNTFRMNPAPEPGPVRPPSPGPNRPPSPGPGPGRPPSPGPGPGRPPSPGPGRPPSPGPGPGRPPFPGPGRPPVPGPAWPPVPPPPVNDRVQVSNAIILDIQFAPFTTYVTIRYDSRDGWNRGQQTVVLVVTRDTRIRDEDGYTIPARELQQGMTINAVFSANMTRSIPPQAQAFQIRVVARPRQFNVTEGRILQIDNQNRFIITIGNSPSSVIRFNVSPQTLILDSAGRQISLNSLIPGLRVRVEHATFMTASIPPQTTAFVIQVIR